MHENIQPRWIEQADARSVREHAAFQRAESEPYIRILHTLNGPTWFDWLRDLARPLRHAIAPVSSLRASKTTLRIAHSRPARRQSFTEIDYDRVLVAILMTDIVDPKKRVAEMGDRNWRVLLDRHGDTTRHQIKRFGGMEVGNRGDGFVGIFNSAARAIRCAAAITDTIAPLGLLVRSGIHVGEVHLKKEQVSGMAVHIAARIVELARPGEAFVSKTVCDLVAGSELVFEDRGTHHLRGLAEEFHLYAMSRSGNPLADG
jgi:class 3 adenylate cyclase